MTATIIPRGCSVPGCERVHLGRGLCRFHHQQFYRSSAYVPAKRENPRYLPVEERFWQKVDKTSTCWLWTGSQAGAGHRERKSYGVFRPKHGTAIYAHRYAYELLIGPIPEGLQLDHLCRVKPCVNPAHLEPVTGWENMQRARPTHCRHGHLFDEANTYWTKLGRKNCRACHAARERIYKVRRRAAA